MKAVTARTFKDYLLLILKGMAMGAADVVPGVSGGTVAFITGIYDELLHSLKQCGPQALLVWYRQGFAEAWRYVNGWFLVAVFGGILLSLKTFAALLVWGLAAYPLQIWGAFSGLILASVVILMRAHRFTSWHMFVAFGIGVGAVVMVALGRPVEVGAEPWKLFLGGFIAICAMILPGVSGSFILLLLGLYGAFIGAIHHLQWLSLAAFGLGCVCGLLVFSRFLSWLLDRFYRTTLALLIGFLVGSLYVTWPWKAVVETRLNHHGEVVPFIRENVLPSSYQAVAGSDPQLFSVVLAAVAGLILVLMSEWLAKKMTH